MCAFCWVDWTSVGSGTRQITVALKIETEKTLQTVKSEFEITNACSQLIIKGICINFLFLYGVFKLNRTFNKSKKSLENMKTGVGHTGVSYGIAMTNVRGEYDGSYGKSGYWDHENERWGCSDCFTECPRCGGLCHTTSIEKWKMCYNCDKEKEKEERVTFRKRVQDGVNAAHKRRRVR